jgi:hypothetical protein
MLSPKALKGNDVSHISGTAMLSVSKRAFEMVLPDSATRSGAISSEFASITFIA